MEEACGPQQAKTVGNVSLLEGTRGDRAGQRKDVEDQKFPWWTKHLRARGSLLPAAPKSTDLFGKFLGHHRLYSAIARHHKLCKSQRGKKTKGASSS